MKYRKIKVACVDCPKRFYRVMYVRSDLNLKELSCAVLCSLRCEFEHDYLFRDKVGSYIPEEWLEDSFFDGKSLTDATLDDVQPFSGNKIILEYDAGDGWAFDLKIYKEEKEIDDDVYGINIEAKGDRIWEDARSAFWDFLNGDPVDSDAVWNIPDGSNPENFDDPIDINVLNDETQIYSMENFDEWDDGEQNNGLKHMEQKRVSGIYRHYKGGIYEAVCTAKHSETPEDMVVYKNVSSDEYWVRPLSMWEETVECDGKRVPRFSYIAPDTEAMDGMRLFGTIEKIVESCLLFDSMSDENPSVFCRKSTGEVITLPCEFGAYLDGDLKKEEILNLDKNKLEQARLIEENPTEYIKVPDEGLLDEYEIMVDFTLRLPPPYSERLENALQGKGAFRRFKETVVKLGFKEDWYRYKDMRYRKEAREWCDAVGINWQGDFLGNDQ